MKCILQVNEIYNTILIDRSDGTGVAGAMNKLENPDKAPGMGLDAIRDMYPKLSKMHSSEYISQLQVQLIIVFRYHKLPVKAEAGGIFLNLFLGVNEGYGG